MQVQILTIVHHKSPFRTSLRLLSLFLLFFFIKLWHSSSMESHICRFRIVSERFENYSTRTSACFGEFYAYI
ncbi:hypothetical protein IC582_011381 [Cucumis melo]